MTIILSAGLAGLTAFALCWAAWRGAFAFLPEANITHRGLHAHPVRSSAGIAIIAATSLAWIQQWLAGSQASLWPAFVAALVLGGTGFVDDRIGLPALVKLAVQVVPVAAIVAIWWNSPAEHSLLFALAIFFALLWFINLYNFMDGSDGLAASQTIIALIPIVAASFFGVVAGSSEIDSTLAALMAATAGFLCFNRPRAMLFMGDAGSLSIPVLIGGIAVLHPNGQVFAPMLLVGFAPFITDASLTLVIRIFFLENLLEGHRSHAYQLFARWTQSHKAPLFLLWVYGLFWLTPIAFYLAKGSLSAMPALALAYGPAFALCIAIQLRLRARMAG